MIFRQLFDPVSSTYTYVLATRRCREALIIDPVKELLDHYLRHRGQNADVSSDTPIIPASEK